MRAGFLILCVGLYCISQAVGFPFCAPRAYSVFFACRLSVPAFCAYTGRSVFCGRAAFSSFCKRYGSLAAPRTGECGALSSVTSWYLPPSRGGGGGTDPAQQRNTGTALCVFARERIQARRFVFLQGREHGHGASYVCKGKEYGRCVPHLCTRTMSAFVHGRGIRR